MKTRLNFLVWAMLITVLIAGCAKDDEPAYNPPGPYANGAFICNEGTYGQENASVSFYDFAGDSVRNSIYTSVNKLPLGQLLQSMYAVNGKVYMVLNLSDTVTVAYSDDFIEAGKIGGLSSPRYMTSCNGKGYITQWGGNGVVKVVDLSSNSVLRTIDVGLGPEQAIVADGNILVCNGGAYGRDSTISVIDPAIDKVVSTVVVGDNPKEMVVDRNNDIWVLCYGYIQYDGSFNIILETPSKLVRLSGQSFEKTGEYIISATQHPQHLDISKDRSAVYYGGGFGYAGIYAMDITAAVTPATPLVDGSKFFYGFNVNPLNGEIFALDATDFTTPGFLFRYSPQGALIKQYTAGIAPNGVLFK
jgi:YVTN family beta-propeller protein